ncbi:MAG: tetratricopeptide repeat protein [Candidatus Sericytochromatia bacterium]
MEERETNSAEVIRATQNRLANPFIEFYEAFVIPEIAKIKPDLLGLTIARDSQVIPTFTLASMIRQHFPDIHVAVGGSFLSKFADGMKQDYHPAFKHLIHSAVKGEGEDPLLKLVQALEGQHALTEVPGLIHADATGKVLVNPIGPALPMSEIWAPDFDGLDLKNYWSPDPIFPLLTSRDCYWKDCAFCDHYMQYASFRSRKPALIADDLEHLQKRYGVSRFLFVDETMSPHYGKLMAKEIAKKDLKIHWCTMSRLQKGFDQETSKIWRDSGCLYIMTGLESANQEVAQSMIKGTETSITEAVYQNLFDAGIYTFAFIFFGFPGETFEQAKETVDFVRNHKDTLNSTWGGVFSLKKNSPMFKELDHFGIIDLHPDDLSNDWATSIRCKVKSGMSYSEALMFNWRFKDALWDIYQAPFWMIHQSRIDIFLYLSRFGRDWVLEQSYWDPDADKIKEAHRYHQQRQWAQAEKIYQEILSRIPEHALVLNYQGLARFQQNDMAAALALFQQSLQLEPGNAEAVLCLGQWYHQQGQLELAREQYRLAIELDPYLAQAHYRLAQSLVPPNAFHPERQALEEALKLCNGTSKILECDRAIGTFTIFDCQGFETYHQALLKMAGLSIAGQPLAVRAG